MYVCDISKILKFVLFADNTNRSIFCSGHDAMQLSRYISNELDKLWFAVNKLILNVSKTNFMVFGNSKQRNTTLQVRIKYSNIKEFM